MSATGLNQLATVFRFVNRFYPAVAGHSFNGYDRLDQVLADWIANHLDYTPGVDILIIFGQVVTMFDVFDIRSLIFEGIAYPDALAETNASLADDARSLVSLMLADINEADQLVSSKPDLVNINEYNKLKNSVLFTNPTSVLNSYWNEYKNLGTMVYNEVGPVEGKPSRWYYEWSPWHSHSMAWGALSSLNNLIPDIYATNPNVAVYDAYFEVNQRRITGPEPAVTFQNNPNVKVVVELYNTSNVSSESLTLRVKKDHSSSNYSSDVLKSSTSFTLDHDPLTYNSTARKKVELSFPVSLSDLSGYKGYYFELVNNSNNKVMFSSSFEQYQERLDLTPNYTRLYGTYDEGKWPVSLGLLQSVATVNLTTPQFDGTAGGYYKINGIPQSSIIGYVDDYINMEAVPSTGAIFWKWSDGNTENPRTYRIPSTTVNLYAFYKSVNASNNTLAFGTNSQKKLVRTTDGRLHKVYSSMNMIWYEMSTDNGATWTVQNNGQPLSSNEAKLPAIDYYGNSYIFITWQEKYNYYGFETFKIRLAYISFPEAHLAFCDVFNASIYDPSPISPYSYDAMPVVAWGNGNVILIAWKLNEICYRYGYLNNYTPITWYTSAYGAFISGTNANSTNPTIAVRKDGGTSVFHLAWQHSITAIKYRSLTPNGSSLSISAEETPSSGDGFNYNVSPSISISSSGYPTLVWIGSIYQSATTQVTKRSKTYSGWSSTFGKYGSNVNSPTEYNSIIVWSEGNVNMLYRPWSSIRTLSTVGKYVQLSYWGSMYAVAHRQYSPYDFQTSPNVISIPKENTVVNKCGREVIIRRGDTEFYFTLADVIVNNEVIKFTEVEDTSTFVNINRVNQYFVTNSFSLYETSNLSFSIAFGTTDSVQATTELKNRSSIQFKLELVDANTNVVLSLIDNVKVGLENIYRYKEQSYKANTDGIVKRFVKFVVNVNTDFEDGSYYIADIFNETDILGKTNLEEIKLTVQPTVTTYGLYQNYPNPFNPTTKIKYQIPEDGIVSLKIYDILGKEVRTLVNEQKTMGRYEVKFDASDLASGVYIYRLNVNDFVSVKKMLLVK
jgi:hypothetical protein